MILVSLTLTSQGWLGAFGDWLAYPSSNQQSAEVIVVLGGGKERTIYGAELFQQGQAPELWHTGYPSAKASALAFFGAHHVPPTAVTFLPSQNTWQDADAVIANAKQRGIRRILLITSWYHSRRAMCVFKQQLDGSDITIFYTRPPGNGPDHWWEDPQSRRSVVSEFIKLSFYALRYGVNPLGC